MDRGFFVELNSPIYKNGTFQEILTNIISVITPFFFHVPNINLSELSSKALYISVLQGTAYLCIGLQCFITSVSYPIKTLSFLRTSYFESVSMWILENKSVATFLTSAKPA